jgi:oxygen-independent coproporphyrinogen-3 oxidase
MRLYCHVPFCRSKCGYCDFCSGHPPDLQGRYLAAIRRERDRRLPPGPLESVYWGGGTPSLLEPSALAPAMRGLALAPGAEATLEANPEDVRPERLSGWRDLGINRLSVGVQSLVEGELEALGRRRSAQDARRAMDLLAAQWANWSVDLIAGMEGQSWRTLSATLDEVLDHRPPHLSLYALEVKPGAPVRAQGPDAAADLLTAAWERLAAAGYRHYEISNFCRPGAEARHNLGYWRREPYCGLGASAHSFLGGVRSWNAADPGEYAEAVEAGRSPAAGEERLEPRQAAWEAFLLGLRLDEGVEPSGIPEERWGALLEAGLVRRREGRMALTERGMLVFNEVALYLEPFLGR